MSPLAEQYTITVVNFGEGRTSHVLVDFTLKINFPNDRKVKNGYKPFAKTGYDVVDYINSRSVGTRDRNSSSKFR